MGCLDEGDKIINMEAEVLNEINQSLTLLKWGMIALFVLFAILVVGALMFFRMMSSVANSRTVTRKDFQNEVEGLLDSGDFESLVTLSKERIKDRKNDIWAYYYEGVSQLKMADYLEAKKSLKKVIEIDPTWEESVCCYIEEAEEKLKLKPVK